MKLELTELIALKTLLILEIKKIEEKNDPDEYDRDNLYKYKSILQKINKQINKKTERRTK